MTFTDGNVFLVDPRRFATIKILKKMEGESQKIFSKNLILKLS